MLNHFADLLWCLHVNLAQLASAVRAEIECKDITIDGPEVEIEIFSAGITLLSPAWCRTSVH